MAYKENMYHPETPSLVFILFLHEIYFIVTEKRYSFTGESIRKLAISWPSDFAPFSLTYQYIDSHWHAVKADRFFIGKHSMHHTVSVQLSRCLSCNSLQYKKATGKFPAALGPEL